MAGLDLFQEMDMLRREIDHAFRGLGRGSAFLPGIGTGEYPRINLSEDDNNYYVEALVPGINPKDLDLNLMRGALTLSGERKADDQKERTWHRHERGSGKFMRTIELPDSIDGSKVDAEYRNGVLLITLPKPQSEQPKKISVRAS
ncbi:HSP20 family protein [Malonomonas rubra DSM 5091]|uniref:HSP20 family protein n=1 Tax=Malonomonas rubra DSM 5091 TaxID=1122189 RepID=A0A1M6H438_MALRU|nr:Hsp20/alpha crystallin family protein [Malonomonas rubra]SHJ16889.1 HSP20 family protein [Malonomonas rubra DSM 5091]